MNRRRDEIANVATVAHQHIVTTRLCGCASCAVGKSVGRIDQAIVQRLYKISQWTNRMQNVPVLSDAIKKGMQQ